MVLHAGQVEILKSVLHFSYFYNIAMIFRTRDFKNWNDFLVFTIPCSQQNKILTTFVSHCRKGLHDDFKALVKHLVLADSAVYAPVLEFSIYILISRDKAWISGLLITISYRSSKVYFILFYLFIIHVISKSKLML